MRPLSLLVQRNLRQVPRTRGNSQATPTYGSPGGEVQWLGRLRRKVLINVPALLSFAQSISKRDHDVLVIPRWKYQFQVTRRFNRFAELPVLICHRADDSAPKIGKNDWHLGFHDLRVVNVEQLSGYDDARGVGLSFKLQINLKGIRAV